MILMAVPEIVTFTQFISKIAGIKKEIIFFFSTEILLTLMENKQIGEFVLFRIKDRSPWVSQQDASETR